MIENIANDFSKCLQNMRKIKTRINCLNRLTAYLLITSLLIASVLTDDTFYLSPKPQDKNVVEGKHVVLECGVGLGVGITDSQNIRIHWNHNNNKIVYDSRRYQRNGSLIIVSADRVKDLGQFTCLATNVSSGHSIRKTIELRVFWLDETIKVRQLDSDSDNEIILNCEASGNPEPKIEWFHNGLKLHRNEQTTVRNKRLHLMKVSVAMNGIYSCRAFNTADKIESTETFMLNVKGEGVPYLELISEYSVVKLDSSFTLNCIFSNALSIEWYAPNKGDPIVNNTRVTVYSNGSLTINKIEKEDNGIFRCVGLPFDKGSPQTEYSIRLQTAFLEDFSSDDLSPTYESSLKLHVVPKGSPRAEFFCVAPKGVPKPELRWEDPNGSIVSDNGRVKVEGNTLIIEGPIKKSDAAKYVCIAQNIAEQKTKDFDIFVAIPPSLTDPISTVADEDGLAYLHCIVNASPHTTIKWIKDGKYIQNSAFHSVLNNGTLIISGSKLSDSGEYLCQIDSMGFQPIRSKPANLTIRERLKFLVIPTNTNLELNSNSKIVCKARGSPNMTVKWVKWTPEGQLKGKGLEWPSHIQDSNGTLHFNGVKREDSGNYTCIATNSQGFINSSIQVVVTVRPTFTVEPKSENVLEGSTAFLHCSAKGEPKPTIQWDKDNLINGFDEPRAQVFYNGTLRIESVQMEDEGKYGCIAGNSGGFSRIEVTLTVKSLTDSYNLGINSEENKNKMTRTVTITLSAAALYMLLVMALMIYCRYRRAKRKATAIARNAQQNGTENGDLELRDRAKPIDNPEQHRLLTTDDKQKQLSVKASIRSEGDVHSQTSSNQSSKRSKSPFERLQVCRQDLQRLCLLGHGEFGEVFLAKANKWAESGQIVLVKALNSKDENIIFDYKREIEMFSKLNHNRIVRLMGLCRDSDPFLVILEYSDWGDLKQFLLATRDDQTSRRGPKPTPLTLPQIIGMSQQIAIAMEYLTNNRFVHKDLATRNCLITSKLDIKISSTSLSKDTYSSDYFNYQNRDIPLRWCPHEAVIEDEWSAKSDVYAFGVTVREICTQAELPFHDKTDSLVIRLLQKNELRLEMPENIPNPLKELLLSCWYTSPKDRPTFSDVCHILNKILLNLNI